MVVLLGWSLAGAGLMNEKAWIFLLRSVRDREWPIAINVDQPKLLPKQQSDRVWSRKGIEIVSACCVCPCCFAKKERKRGRTHGAGVKEARNGQERENEQPVIWLFNLLTLCMPICHTIRNPNGHPVL